MNDLIPIAFFVGCMVATFGLVRVCEWLVPASSGVRGGMDVPSASGARHEEAAR